MDFLRRFGKALAVGWLAFVVLMAIGGTWLSNGGYDAMLAASPPPETAAETLRASRREARELHGAGWGDETVDGQAADGAWGTDTL